MILISAVWNGRTQPIEWWIIVCFHCRYLASIAKKSLSARRILTPYPAPSMSLTGRYRKRIIPSIWHRRSFRRGIILPSFSTSYFTFSFRRPAKREKNWLPVEPFMSLHRYLSFCMIADASHNFRSSMGATFSLISSSLDRSCFYFIFFVFYFNYSSECIVLKMDDEALGIHVVPDYDQNGNDRGLLVQKIDPGGKVDRDGRLSVNDRIVEINDRNLLNQSLNTWVITVLYYVLWNYYKTNICRGELWDEKKIVCGNNSKKWSL